MAATATNVTPEIGTVLVDVTACLAVRPPRRGSCEAPDLVSYEHTGRIKKSQLQYGVTQNTGRPDADGLFNAESVLMDTPQACVDLCMRYPSCLAASYIEDWAQCPKSGPELCCETCPARYFRYAL